MPEEDRSPIVKDAPKPATLPATSRAAAAQRLNALPEKPARGAYYAVPHRKTAPTGWRTRRYIKRRHLRRSIEQYAIVDRMGTRYTMLPMAFIALLIMVLVTGLMVGLTAAVEATQQRYSQQVITLEDILPKDSLKMYDEHGTMIYQMVDQGLQTTVPLSQISQHLINAEVATEDQNFWSDPGIDITGIVRAAIADLSHGHIVSGGSTITQQLIKNNIVGNQDTVLRKLQEIILAPQVTRYYTKQQIMSMYLNTTYYGEQAYGADAAAFTYFDLQDTPTRSAASQLDIAQAAMLAGIPSSPVARDPFLYPQAAAARIHQVLDLMRTQGYITPLQERQALAEASSPHFLHRGIIHNDRAPHFAAYAVNELATTLNVKPADLARAGLVVSTTLDLPLQNQILKIAQKHIAELAQAHHMSDAAVVLIDFHNGAIRTLLGNIDPNNPQYGAFDVATQGYRQPGSSFKPFIYATAYEQGLSPGMPVMDGPFTIQMCCGLPPYSPSNYDQSYHGLITYRYALQNSFNIPAVKVLTKVGVANALHTAEAMGVTSYTGTPNYTMVLGTLGVHLLDETAAYGVFANGGVRIPPHAINTVVDVQGHLIYQFAAQGKRVLSKQVAYMMTSVLSDNASRTFEFGKCSALYLYSNTQLQCYEGNPGTIRPAAVKTGTSQNFDDNWTVGYTTDYVLGVWAGNNDNSPMINVTGVDGAGPIWHDSMLLAEQGRPVTDFANPGGLVKETVHYPQGLTTTDWYIPGVSGGNWYL
ncbi:MAG TPA: transglycosylase domain-containing protein [Ktedonobacteraceae bacterium]|jgi:membrane peptidoglycan carboxypeptidase|nr:transglycosylase domain-containing protein [Ktedonobacteraceae bacterium]